MARLLVGNDFIEDEVGATDARQKRTAWWTHRILWFARDGDVLVLAVAPEDHYLDYVTGLTGTDRSTLQIVVPPPGRLGVGLLTADRLADDGFRVELLAALAGRPVDDVVTLHPDDAVVALAESIGAGTAVPGHGFLRQGGGRVVNSKAIFRAIAGGVGVPLPAGAVCPSPAAAEEAIAELFAQGHHVMLKHDFRSGGRGNEILSLVEGIEPVGARRVVVLPDAPALHAYLSERWPWLTSHGRYQLVVERYHPGSSAVFAEFDITDDGPQFGGQGEMVSAPMAMAEIIPAPGLDTAAAAVLIDGGRRLCDALHAMGYRGMLSADAIITPDGNILFTEYNGRVTGSTHIYSVIGRHIVGADYATTRVLLEKEGWAVPSFQEAAAGIDALGLAYDPDTRTGAVLVMNLNPTDSTVRYCVVGVDLDTAVKDATAIEELFVDAAVDPTTTPTEHWRTERCS